MDVDEVGHAGARRERVYVIMAHRIRTKPVFDPHKLHAAIRDTLKRLAHTSPSDYFVSDATEIRLCAEDMALTRKKTKRLKYDPRSLF